MNHTFLRLTFATLIAAAGILMAQQKLQDLGVKDVQTLLDGSPEGLSRLAKMVDAAVAANPKDAYANFMHGVVAFSRSGIAAKQGDLAAAGKLFQSGLAEMEEAVRADPDNIGILAPRGAMLLGASREMPPQLATPLLQSAISDFEHLLSLQQNDGTFPKLSNHQRGELLTGLGDGWARLGQEDKARGYFERIAKDLPGTVYQNRAQDWLAGKSEAKSAGYFTCVGCHVSK
jgi:tetratricopeptide (TPR) repeat protein